MGSLLEWNCTCHDTDCRRSMLPTQLLMYSTEELQNRANVCAVAFNNVTFMPVDQYCDATSCALQINGSKLQGAHNVGGFQMCFKSAATTSNRADQQTIISSAAGSRLSMVLTFFSVVLCKYMSEFGLV